MILCQASQKASSSAQKLIVPPRLQALCDILQLIQDFGERRPLKCFHLEREGKAEEDTPDRRWVLCSSSAGSPKAGQWHPSIITTGLGHTLVSGAFWYHHLVIQPWAAAEKQPQNRSHGAVQLKQRQQDAENQPDIHQPG